MVSSDIKEKKKHELAKRAKNQWQQIICGAKPALDFTIRLPISLHTGKPRERTPAVDNEWELRHQIFGGFRLFQEAQISIEMIFRSRSPASGRLNGDITHPARARIKAPGQY